MNSDTTTPRLLGAAFLLQAVASAVSGLVLAPVDLIPASVIGDVADVMTTIANGAMGMRASIVGEMITGFGVVMLGSLMYVVLKKQNRNIALVALGLYLVEVALLGLREVLVFSLLRISQGSVLAGHPTDLQTLGNLLYESQSFAYTLHTLFFALGATLFYSLFFRSRSIPRVLALWGLIAAPLAFIGTLLELFAISVPLYVFLPNLPFELTIGVWLIVKGIRDGSEAK